MHRFPAYIQLCTCVLAACTSTPPAQPGPEEQAQAVNEVFETPEVYSPRTLDSLDVSAFLDRHPEYQADSLGIRGFYERRGMQFAWFIGDTLSQAALNFLNLVDGADSTLGTLGTEHSALHDLVRRIADETDTVPLTDRFFVQLELSLTAQFFRFADRKYGGVVRKDLRELDWFIPRRKKDYRQLIDSLAAGRMDLSPIEPVHPQYQLLKRELQRLYGETWIDTLPLVDLGDRRKLEPGDRDSTVLALRRRLIAFGDLEATADSGLVMDSTLVAGLQRFQERHGLLPDGVAGKGVVKQINTSVSDRIRTILVNMERLRWVPEVQPPNVILVNIPEYRMHIYEADTLAWSMNVVVGATATRTVVFSDELTTIVFNPYWNIPRSIIRNEILPAVKRNSSYLAQKNMEVVRGGQVVPASTIDWSQYTGSVPFEIRQKPGTSNSLGLVKFLFPNEFSIYFHDTPSKSLFGRESRAFSHGCIRLGQPMDLAEYLLKPDTNWTADSIRTVMARKKEKYVDLPEPRPVIIGYFTAWVDTQGRLNFRDDVYEHDARLAQELFALPEEEEEAVASVK